MFAVYGTYSCRAPKLRRSRCYSQVTEAVHICHVKLVHGRPCELGLRPGPFRHTYIFIVHNMQYARANLQFCIILQTVVQVYLKLIYDISTLTKL